MIKVKQFEFNMFGESTFVVYDTDTRKAIVVDAGMLTPDEHQELDEFLKEQNLTLTDVVNTHMHVDHSFGVNALKQKYGVKLAAGVNDLPLAQSLPQQSMHFRIPWEKGKVEVDRPLKEGDTVQVGNYQLKVLDVPGHSPGSIALYSPEGKFVLTGDALFKGSIGRTDLYGGNHEQLINSIRNKLYTLADDTIVLPGHGPMSTIGREKLYNSFVRAN